MSTPILERFWRSMGERFGKRWLDEYGPKPTRAWEEALRPWDASVISGALEMMGEKGWQHPPTLPQFQALLRDADRKHGKPAVDYVRGFWRTTIVEAAAQAAGMTVAGFEPYLAANGATLGEALRRLLNEFDTRDKVDGRRTPELVRWCEDRAAQAVRDVAPRAAA